MDNSNQTIPQDSNGNQLTIAKIRKYLSNHGTLANATRLSTIAIEFERGFEFLDRKQKSVTFFGSARTDENHRHYKQAYELAKMLATELDYSVVTGGGSGIMEAGNRGAKDALVPSYGMTIMLPSEQKTNPYVTEEINFHYFFSRKVLLSFAASAYIYFPGGFGTLDELFEILTLVQTKKIEPVPVILFGSDFWEPLDLFIKQHLVEKFKTINSKDRELYTVTDNPGEVINIVRQAAKPRS